MQEEEKKHASQFKPLFAVIKGGIVKDVACADIGTHCRNTCNDLKPLKAAHCFFSQFPVIGIS